jgi:hypothetical protein
LQLRYQPLKRQEKLEEKAAEIYFYAENLRLLKGGIGCGKLVRGLQRGFKKDQTEKAPMLVYKDAEDEDEDMHGEEDEEDNDDEFDEDEEIKEIDIKAKRQKRTA